VASERASRALQAVGDSGIARLCRATIRRTSARGAAAAQRAAFARARRSSAPPGATRGAGAAAVQSARGNGAAAACATRGLSPTAGLRRPRRGAGTAQKQPGCEAKTALSEVPSSMKARRVCAIIRLRKLLVLLGGFGRSSRHGDRQREHRGKYLLRNNRRRSVVAALELRRRRCGPSRFRRGHPPNRERGRGDTLAGAPFAAMVLAAPL